jgi:hypothetical protein
LITALNRNIDDDLLSSSDKGSIRKVGITDKKGNLRFDGLPPGEYKLNISKEGYVPKIQRVLIRPNVEVKVSLDPINKSALKHENERLRATIFATTILSNIDLCVARSEALMDLSPPNCKKPALKEFKKTSKVAHNRIEELRTSQSGFAVGGEVSTSGKFGGFRRRSEKTALVR